MIDFIEDLAWISDRKYYHLKYIYIIFDLQLIFRTIFFFNILILYIFGMI